MAYYALFTITHIKKPWYSLFSSFFSDSVEYHFSFNIYGEMEDIEEFYEGKDYVLEPIELVNKEGRLVNHGEKLPLSNLYKILYSHGLEANYILADDVLEAEKAYRCYCYSNLKKLVEKGVSIYELVRFEKVVQCIRKDGIVNIIV